MRYLLLACCAALTLTVMAGCSPPKATVTGVVTLDGKPLDNGEIQFFPADGDGQTAGDNLKSDGTYRVEATPTKMKVVVSSSKVVRSRKKYADVPDSPMVEEREQVLAARYSDRKKTELTITVVPGENKKDFELTSDPKPGK